MSLRKWFHAAIDICGALPTALMAPLAHFQARHGALQLPLTYRIWDQFSVSPINHHFYEPIFPLSRLAAEEHRSDLAGVAWNESGQLALLHELLRYRDELNEIPLVGAVGTYHFANTTYGPGDGKSLYAMLRQNRPQRFVEIGCGYSTLIAARALEKNRLAGSPCDHVCIDPYPPAWIPKNVELIQQPVERCGAGSVIFDLAARDILFIDSSHVLRTGGDVTFEYLELLPRLASGVLVHIHDIFLPYGYPGQWLRERRFWTEQYVVQAFLAFNSAFDVLLATHWLSRAHRDHFLAAFPALGRSEFSHRFASAFWLRRSG